MKKWLIMFILFKYIHQSWSNYLSIRSFPSHADTGEIRGIKPWPVWLCQVCNKGRRTDELQLSFQHEKSIFQVSHILRFQGLFLARLKVKTAVIDSFPNKLCFAPPNFTEVRATWFPDSILPRVLLTSQKHTKNTMRNCGLQSHTHNAKRERESPWQHSQQ